MRKRNCLSLLFTIILLGACYILKSAAIAQVTDKNSRVNNADMITRVNYDSIPDNTWVLLDEGNYQKTEAGLCPPRGILAYSGMAVDLINNQVIVFGGGHNDYWGNEIWAWDIQGRYWTKMYEPDMPNCADTDNINLPGMLVSKGRPISRHTYDSVEFLSREGLIFAGGASTYSGPGDELWQCYLNSPKDSWAYNFSMNEWTYLNAQRQPQPSIGSAAYDPVSGLLVATTRDDSYQQETWIYDYQTDTWTQRKPANKGPYAYHGSLTYDSKRQLIYQLGSDAPPHYQLWAYDITGNNWSQINTSPENQPPVGYNNGWGIAYDPNNDVLAIFGDDGLWILNLESKIWIKDQDNQQIKPISNDNVFGKLKFNVNFNLFFMVQVNSGYYADVWAYRYKYSPISTNFPPSIPKGLRISN